MTIPQSIPLIVWLFVLAIQTEVFCQTTIQGKLISVDGSTIPESVISIDPVYNQDLFSEQYEDLYPDEEGSYQFHIQKPGIYRVTFRGVFHHDMGVPIMIYDQSSMNMNILLMPIYFNDGLYFKEDNYLEWIRVVGNFNDYDFNKGQTFSLNPDGSISAFIPVHSDTLRYQVHGLTYNQGAGALPQADEYGYREDRGFESVLYNNLPEDSLEIRFDPQESVPFKMKLPYGVEPQSTGFRGVISLQNQEDENWIRPLDFLQPFFGTLDFVEWEKSAGISNQPQIELEKRFFVSIFDRDLGDELDQIYTDLSNENLHPQQKAILTMSYASILGWMSRKTQFQQMRATQETEQKIPEIEPDNDIINSIPEIVSPVHPAWSYNNGAVDYLLTETDNPKKFIDYFHDVVKYNPSDRAVRHTASSMIRHLGSGYSSVEEMPVYQVILDRYGENDLARDAHQAFDFSQLED